ncbi:hypothetical protein [Sphingomonas sp.]|uniref:hypothetical protein n=1 Tax=Sphingomonas sp. TaxID=28214 RepID=UPI003566611F
MSKELRGTAITDRTVFVQRAVPALMSGATEWEVGFIQAIWRAESIGCPITDQQFQMLCKIVNRHAPTITDRPVADYAALKAKGAD